jgi:hypothetical protein
MRYPGGQLAQFSSSFESPQYTGVEIYGTSGRLVVTRPFSNIENSEVILIENDDKKQSLPIPPKPLYLGEIEDIENAALFGASPLLSLAETRGHIATVTALLRSARERKPVAL